MDYCIIIILQLNYMVKINGLLYNNHAANKLYWWVKMDCCITVTQQIDKNVIKILYGLLYNNYAANKWIKDI